MSFLRERAGAIIVVAIGLAIVAFLLGDAIRSSSGFIADANSEIGVIDGHKVSYQNFNERVEQNSQQFRAQMGNLNSQMQSYIVENTWNQMTSSIILENQTAKLGLSVGNKELFNLLFEEPSPQMQQIFADPQTGQFNRTNAISSRKSAETEPTGQLKQQWIALEESIEKDRANQKYLSLIRNGIYANSLDAKDEYTNKNKLVNFDYVVLDYSSINNADVKPTDADYKEYYDQNKYRFKSNTDTRTFEYVAFDASPSKQDTADAKTKIEKIAEGLKATDNDSLYVSINADTKTPISYQKKGTLEPALDSVMFNVSKGYVFGPYLSDGAYKVAKLVDTRISPDSVKARHILINPATEGGMGQAKAKADSIKNLIQKGASFATLASEFGTDGSKDSGGDLGTFARGSMVPQFEEAVFNGHPGQLLTVETQYGVHVIEIQKQVGSSKVVKVAIVDKQIAPSSQTEQLAYQKAQSFIASVKNQKQFEETAQKQGVNKLVAEDVTPLQGGVPGLDDARNVVRWAFKADKGDVSDEIFNVGNKYVVAVLTEVKPKGTLSLENVKKSIEPAVINLVKARMLKEKADKALNGATNIAQVAQKLNVTVNPVENIVFANPIIPGYSQENKVIGSIFGSQPNKVSKAIDGERGVYVYAVKGFTNPAAFTGASVAKSKESLSQSLSSQAEGAVFEVLKEKAKIKDNRAKFY
ncbi:peptidylprolyl isomerase [Pseudopedobacter beijingensis]|uniref:Periplasmic chaperone PpiD n=1 Tax=Pseudopedobacter beijingensis TaxID=1207056 RepID=A0ABW4I8L2_9SPHI